MFKDLFTDPYIQIDAFIARFFFILYHCQFTDVGGLNMTEALTVGDEESRSTARKVMIPTTPIILSYLVENEKATRNDITKVVYSVSSKLRSTNVRVNAVFRGNLKNPDLGIESETVDSEIWYWLSNKFIVECDSQGKGDLCFQINEMEYLKEYKLENLCENLKEINWNTETNRKDFLRALRDVIRGTSAGVHE